MIRMAVAPVRERDDFRLRAADQLDHRPHLFGHVAELPVRQPEVYAPRGAEHDARLLGLAQPLLRRPVAAHLSACQIADADGQSPRDVLRDRRAHADLDIVWMRAERQDVDWGGNHQEIIDGNAGLAGAGRPGKGEQA